MGHQRRRFCLRAAGRSTFEQLEPRQMLSGSADTSGSLAADGLVPIRWQGEHTYAAPGQWIAVIDRPAGFTRRAIRQINKQLAGTGLRAVRRLNATNLFLFRGVQKPTAQVRATLSKLSGIKTGEPDTIRDVKTL